MWKICDAAVHVACTEHFSWLEGVADTLKVLQARDLVLQPLIRSGGEATVTTVCVRVFCLNLSKARGVVVSHPLRMRKAPGLNPQCVHAILDFLLSGCSLVCVLEIFRKFDRRSMDHVPGRSRTCNPRLRWPMPYPLTTGPSIVAEERTRSLRRRLEWSGR